MNIIMNTTRTKELSRSWKRFSLSLYSIFYKLFVRMSYWSHSKKLFSPDQHKKHTLNKMVLINKSNNIESSWRNKNPRLKTQWYFYRVLVITDPTEKESLTRKHDWKTVCDSSNKKNMSTREVYFKMTQSSTEV